jgi:hypothetical protein
MKLTGTVLITVALALVAYDIRAAVTPEEGDTISEVIAEAARKRPIVAFGFGVLAGHWFWSLGGQKNRGRL